MDDENFALFLGGAFQYPPSFSPQLGLLLARMWDIDPAQRITITQVERDAWVASGDPTWVSQACPDLDGGMDVEPAVQTLSDEFIIDSADEAHAYEAAGAGNFGCAPPNPEADAVIASDKFGTRATLTMSTNLSVAVVLERLFSLCKEYGAIHTIVHQDGYAAEVDVAFQDGRFGTRQPVVKWFVCAGQGHSLTTIAMKRAQGCSVAFNILHEELRPKISALLEAASGV